MPLYAYRGIDTPDSADKRPGAREDHLAKLRSADAAGRIRFAGPLLDEAGRPRGSLVVFEAGDFAAARAFAESDPYLAAGVFERVEVWETKAVFPA